MSFVGGGAADCSANGNALAQFNKHTQQDRSLQRQSANQQGIAHNGGAFRQENSMNPNERMNMEQFMSKGQHHNTFQFQPMKHELNMIQHQQVPNAMPNTMPNSWGQEFQTHTPSPVSRHSTPMANQGMKEPNSAWASEFRQQPRGNNVEEARAEHYTGLSSMMMPSYRPTMGMGMGMGMGMTGAMSSNPLLQKNREELTPDQQIDWDNQFKEAEEFAQEVNAERQKGNESPEIVIDDKYQATFQEVWDSLNSEEVENDLLNQQYEDFKNTQKDLFPADMSQWERDFAKYASTRAHFGDYQFEDAKQNQFMDLPQDQDPFEIGLQLMENGAKLSEAALAFEAAIQRNESHIDAWLKLGEVQTQNEKEIAGISALEKCLELHPENLEALMTLAISYINEGYDNAAFATLERWISTKYPQVAEKARQVNPTIDDEDRFSLNKRVTELFLNAAQLSPNQANMDPDVQMGLGVLFYANEEFDKTIDCFKAALNIKPNDAVLWNRLGASLANSNRSEEAVNAYFKALELKPTFVRARYNLGVSCINVGCYKEAAEYLLSGLAMHQVEGADSNSTLSHNQSSSLMETLKRAFIAMDRRDLLEQVRPGMDLDQFRSEFKF